LEIEAVMADPEKRSGDTVALRGAVRNRMVEGAVRLLATKGVEGTSFAEVLDATDSPRGSLYHHFPGGKSELLHAALDLASERGLAAMEATRGQPAAVVIERFLDLWRGLLEYSELSAGCAVVAVTVAANDDDLLDHAGTIFRSWTELLSGLCVAGGMDTVSARSLAVTVIAATEGVVALCRAERSMEPFEEVHHVLLSLVESHGAVLRSDAHEPTTSSHEGNEEVSN
jgi:AcrR family transcriptional regulator